MELFSGSRGMFHIWNPDNGLAMIELIDGTMVSKYPHDFRFTDSFVKKEMEKHGIRIEEPIEHDV